MSEPVQKRTRVEQDDMKTVFNGSVLHNTGPSDEQVVFEYVDSIRIAHINSSKTALQQWYAGKSGTISSAVAVTLRIDDDDDEQTQVHYGFSSDGGWHPTTHSIVFVRHEHKYRRGQKQQDTCMLSKVFPCKGRVRSVLDGSDMLASKAAKRVMERIAALVKKYHESDEFIMETLHNIDIDEKQTQYATVALITAAHCEN